jgi:hypothetical protein
MRLHISYLSALIDSRLIAAKELSKLADSFDTKVVLAHRTPQIIEIKEHGKLIATISQKNETSPIKLESTAGAGYKLFTGLQVSSYIYRIVSIRMHVKVNSTDFIGLIAVVNDHFRSSSVPIKTQFVNKDTCVFYRHGKHPIRYTVSQIDNDLFLSVIYDDVARNISHAISSANGLNVSQVEDMAAILEITPHDVVIPTIIKRQKVQIPPLENMVASYRPHIAEYFANKVAKGSTIEDAAIDLGKFILGAYNDPL